MLGSMAPQIPNPTAQDPNDVFFIECADSSLLDAFPTVMLVRSTIRFSKLSSALVEAVSSPSLGRFLG
ncbi:hypothetical protein S245_052416, partial [Arachis hypogaea]